MLYRTDLLLGVSKTIPVIDWSMGTLHFEEKASVKTTTTHPGPPLTTTETVTADYDDIRDYIVTDGKGAQVFGMLEGIVTRQAVTLEGHEKYELTSHTAGACITEGDPLGDEVTDDHFVRDLMGQGVHRGRLMLPWYDCRGTLASAQIGRYRLNPSRVRAFGGVAPVRRAQRCGQFVGQLLDLAVVNRLDLIVMVEVFHRAVVAHQREAFTVERQLGRA